MTSVAERARSTPRPSARDLIGRISPLEWGLAAVVAVVMLVLVLLEPDMLEAPFASTRATVAFFGGTALAAVALVVMLHYRVHPLIRVAVLGVPFVLVSWWLISPYFVDDVVDEAGPSIAAAERNAAAAPTTAPPAAAGAPADTSTTTTAPAGPVLRGSGTLVGLAGHDGTGDAAIIRLPDGSQVLRFEHFDIENGPDLKLYLVPGADQRSPGDGSHFFGDLRGNIGDQTYEIPADFDVGAGPWTALVWCEAFTVEFVAATIDVT